eukprot:5284471-Amphidinium_carterae.1
MQFSIPAERVAAVLQRRPAASAHLPSVFQRHRHLLHIVLNAGTLKMIFVSAFALPFRAGLAFQLHARC